jgi:acetylornithine deacetylase/succinyl-diaminopimelate desuccinylase-like protein
MTETPTAVPEQVDALLADLLDDLAALIAIPSIAFPGFPAEPVHRMSEAVVDLFHRSGVPEARLLDIPGGYPAVWAEVPAPPGAPTVLLYAHYDVQPAPDDQGWDTDPFVATRKDDGRIYGRGASDDKSGLIIHAGTLRALRALQPDGGIPVGVKILIEGEEETDSHLDGFVRDHPEMFDCDAFVVADMGNLEVGRPALTTALRGVVVCTVTVRTLDFPVHSGEFGGAAPDALLALIRVLATLHDAAGDTVIPGLTHFTWDGGDLDEALFRRMAGMRDGTTLVGTGSLASRLWSKPSATVIGMDVPTVAHGSNVLIPQARAKISLRIAPGADPEAELAALTRHLESAVPWGAEITVTDTGTGWPFSADLTHRAVRAAEAGLTQAFGRPVETVGSGGSIPLVNLLQRAAPHAGVILWGAEDMKSSRIHASNESVDPAELRDLIVAQTLTLQSLGRRGETSTVLEP